MFAAGMGQGRRGVAAVIVIAGLTLGAAAASRAQPTVAESRGQAFWQALAKQCTVPGGETAFGLVGEALTLAGSADRTWRDQIGYDVVANCVYQARVLKPEERRTLVARLIANLQRGIGSTGDDSVLLRSFSALDLSIFAALEPADPALDEAGYRALVEAAFAYLQAERDLRGLEPRVGWIHATAHTADLLKFLARDPRFAAADQGRLLDATWAKLTAPGTPVFTHAEDERLAAAIASIVPRADFDVARFTSWLERFPELEKRVWAKATPEPQALDAAQNARNLLRCLFVALTPPQQRPAGAEGQPPPPAVGAARDKVLATLHAIRRS